MIMWFFIHAGNKFTKAGGVLTTRFQFFFQSYFEHQNCQIGKDINVLGAILYILSNIIAIELITNVNQ